MANSRKQAMKRPAGAPDAELALKPALKRPAVSWAEPAVKQAAVAAVAVAAPVTPPPRPRRGVPQAEIAVQSAAASFEMEMGLPPV